MFKNHKRILFLGVGESRMCDDGFGPYISYSLLQKMVPYTFPLIKIINGKTDYIERKREILEFCPELLILFDTCQPNFGEPEPSEELYLHHERDFVNWLPLSSHVLPIPVFIEELKSDIPNLKTVLIGVIPICTKHVEEVVDEINLDNLEKNPDIPFFKFHLSPKIHKIADELVDYILKILLAH